MAWTDFLGGALGAAPSLLERRRQFDADQDARRQQQQFQQIQLALAARDQELQEQTTRRELAKEILAAVGPGGTITDEGDAAAVGEFYKSKLQKQDATLPSTAVVPGEQPNALPAALPDGGIVVGGGGANAEVSSPGQQAGMRIVPNMAEQAAIDTAADTAQQRRLRNQLIAELESGRAFAQPPQKLDQLRAIGSTVGVEIPATFDEWKTKEDYEQKNRLAQIDAQGRNTIAAWNVRSGSTGGGGGTQLTPEAIDMAAYQYIQTGSLPPLGMGAAGVRQQILNRAGEIGIQAGGTNPQLNKALFTADQSALTQLTKNMTAISAYKDTARKNISVLVAQAQKLMDSGSPLLNQPIRAFAKATGDPNVAGFEAARRTVIPEISRILTNPNLVGVLSDSARREAEELLQGNVTVPQLMSVINVLDQDMTNRSVSLQQEYDTLIRRMQSRGPQGPAPAPGAPAQGAPAPSGSDPLGIRNQQ